MALTKVGKEGITNISNSSDATAISIDSSEIATFSNNIVVSDRVVGANDLVLVTTDSNEKIHMDSDGFIKIETNGSERARINSSGMTLFGCTANPSSSVQGFAISPNVPSISPHLSSVGSNNGAMSHFYFINGNGTIGSIVTNGSATAYNTSSDYRLKENVVTDWDATTRLKQLKPSRFNFKTDADITVDGFLAHEVSSIVPEAITGEKDATNEDGSIKAQGIDQSKLVPLLVKTIQELEARITALESK